jgi:hypothetical protein
MAGFGTGPYGLSPLGFPTDEPEQLAPAKVGSAVKIDAKTRRYVVADDGGFEAMDGTAQRVLLLVCLAIGKEAPFITPQGDAEMEQRIRAALAPLTDTRDPDIELETVEITSDRSTSNRLVRYKNLRTGTYQYVLAR